MDCTLCEEPITNPLCPDCLGVAIEQWLQQAAPVRATQVREQTDMIRHTGGETCIRCKHRFSICTYCYSKHMFNWLADGKLQLQYLQFFNFFT